MAFEQIVLAIALAALAALIYTLRVLVIVERKVSALCEKEGIHSEQYKKR